MSIMANFWAKKGWEITVLTFDDGRKPVFYDLHPGVKHIPIGIAKPSLNYFDGVFNNLFRLYVLRKFIKKIYPDVVISFMDKTNVLTLLATRGLGFPVIVSERNDPVQRPIGNIEWKILRKILYRRSACLVMQSQSSLDSLSSALRRKAFVIPNPVPIPLDKEISTIKKGGENSIVALGKLEYQKGHDLLLKAFARIAPRHPTWSLSIWGKGPMKESLESLRDSLGLRGRAHIHGQTQHPMKILRQADLFVLASRFEGFPNALCEAMICGLPVISFDCPNGPGDIIQNGVNGILVPVNNIEALASAMDRLMKDKGERERIAANGPNILERYDVDKIMKIWEGVLRRFC